MIGPDGAGAGGSIGPDTTWVGGNGADVCGVGGGFDTGGAEGGAGSLGGGAAGPGVMAAGGIEIACCVGCGARLPVSRARGCCVSAVGEGRWDTTVASGSK